MNRLRVGLTCLARLRSFCNREPSDTLSLSSCCVAVAAPRCVCVICSFPCMSWREQKKKLLPLFCVVNPSQRLERIHRLQPRHSLANWLSFSWYSHTDTHKQRHTHTGNQLPKVKSSRIAISAANQIKSLNKLNQ